MATITKVIGNTTITVIAKSDWILMTPEERGEWFRKQLEDGDPVCLALVETANRILTAPKSTT